MTTIIGCDISVYGFHIDIPKAGVFVALLQREVVEQYLCRVFGLGHIEIIGIHVRMHFLGIECLEQCQILILAGIDFAVLLANGNHFPCDFRLVLGADSRSPHIFYVCKGAEPT